MEKNSLDRRINKKIVLISSIEKQIAKKFKINKAIVEKILWTIPIIFNNIAITWKTLKWSKLWTFSAYKTKESVKYNFHNWINNVIKSKNKIRSKWSSTLIRNINR